MARNSKKCDTLAIINDFLSFFANKRLIHIMHKCHNGKKNLHADNENGSSLVINEINKATVSLFLLSTRYQTIDKF